MAICWGGPKPDVTVFDKSSPASFYAINLAPEKAGLKPFYSNTGVRFGNISCDTAAAVIRVLLELRSAGYVIDNQALSYLAYLDTRERSK